LKRLFQSGSDSSFLEGVNQFSCPVHLQQDVTPTHKDSIDVDLRDSRPVTVLLDSLAQFFVGEDIVSRVLDTMHSEYLGNGITKSTARSLGHSLHEDDHFGLMNEIIKLALQLWSQCF
jgi:hypothetical protein